MDKNEAAVLLGKLAGASTLKKHGREHFKRISALGVAARKKKKLERTQK